MGAFLVIVLPLALGLWLTVLHPPSDSLAADWFTLLLALMLLAVLCGILMAGVIPVVAPGMAPREHRAIVWLLSACLLAPLAFGTWWSTHSGPAVRRNGEIPDVVALLGQSEPTVERLLGNTVRTSGWEASATLVAMPPATRGQTRPVIYGLPDLSTGDPRGIQRLLQPFGLRYGDVASNAKVIVFFSAEGRAIVAHLEIDRTKAEDLLGQGWLDTLPVRAGLGKGLVKVAAPSWAESDYSFDRKGVDRWGSATLHDRKIAYHVHTLAKTPSAVRSTGVGAVSLTIGEGLLDPTPVLTPASDGDLAAASSRNAGPGRPRKATRDFYDRTFYAIILAEERSQKEAQRSADIFNKRASASGEASPAVAVEGAGHLELSDDDSYLVVYVIGYDTQQDAWRQAYRLWGPMRTIPSTRQVRKWCGDLTFIDIE